MGVVRVEEVGFEGCKIVYVGVFECLGMFDKERYKGLF